MEVDVSGHAHNSTDRLIKALLCAFNQEEFEERNALTGDREGAHLVAILSTCEVDVSSKSNAPLNKPIAAQ